jgi:predicted MFS family arabinose efflux permease
VVTRHPGLRGVVGLAFVGSFCAMPLTTFLPVFARDVFHSDEQRYAVLLAAFGVGAVLGAVGMASVASQVRRKGSVGVTAMLGFGIATGAFALSRVPALSYLLLALSGALLMVVFASFMTLVQTHVTDDLRGRVVSLYGLAFRGAMPLGNLTAGTATRWLSAPHVLVANGLVVVAAAAFVLLRRARAGVLSLVDDGAPAG